MTPLLQATGLTKTYEGRIAAVAGVDVSAAAGDFIAIHGPSGCGKSTLLFLLGGLLQPDGGEVLIAGDSLYDLAPNTRARLRGERIGFVFQQFHLVPYLGVRENILAPTLAGPPVDQARAEDLMERFGLIDRATHTPARLSVGEQQRTALARALLREPPILLADEPTGNLDPENRDTLLAHLSDYAASGHAVVMVSHDEHAIAAAHRALPIAQGALSTP